MRGEARTHSIAHANEMSGAVCARRFDFVMLGKSKLNNLITVSKIVFSIAITDNLIITVTKIFSNAITDIACYQYVQLSLWRTHAGRGRWSTDLGVIHRCRHRSNNS